jgi:hypothetical protein
MGPLAQACPLASKPEKLWASPGEIAAREARRQRESGHYQEIILSFPRATAGRGLWGAARPPLPGRVLGGGGEAPKPGQGLGRGGEVAQARPWQGNLPVATSWRGSLKEPFSECPVFEMPKAAAARP